MNSVVVADGSGAAESTNCASVALGSWKATAHRQKATHQTAPKLRFLFTTTLSAGDGPYWSQMNPNVPLTHPKRGEILQDRNSEEIPGTIYLFTRSEEKIDYVRHTH
jgi:hypothetical protein